MAMRAFKLPQDLTALIELIPPTFQYPENPEWSVQEDEVENWVDGFSGARRIWPLIRLAQLVSPPLRDMMRGYVWEEDGKPVALVNVMRQGNTDRWYIGNVSVLPDYRRRGIARQLAEKSVEYARQRGAKAITLDVIAGNEPAYRLYEKLGFEHFAGNVQMRYELKDGQPEPVSDQPVPDGYRVEPASAFDWRPRYELARRITPDAVRAYTPVEEGRFRQPAVLRPLMPVVDWAMGSRALRFLAHHTPSGQVVASARCNIRRRAGGVNYMDVTSDPQHPELGRFLVHYLLKTIWQASPGRRIEFMQPAYQESVIEAAEAAGFASVSEYHTMGMRVE
ncbi:MAG: GNAT family N-acetyltransferase [Anaerolineae bacterium]|nr:GNAT family N-acetyltransferase [Anaerolineae bacterium]